MSTEVEVTIFGRQFSVTVEQMVTTESTLTLLDCVESLSAAERDTLRAAWRIVHDLRTSSGVSGAPDGD